MMCLNVLKCMLLNFSVLINNDIETFIDFSLHLGDLGINYGLTSLENRFGKLRENILFVIIVYDAGLCHEPVPVVKKKIYLRIDTYILTGSGLGSLYFLHCYIITSVVILDVFHLDVTES